MHRHRALQRCCCSCAHLARRTLHCCNACAHARASSHQCAWLLCTCGYEAPQLRNATGRLFYLAGACMWAPPGLQLMAMMQTLSAKATAQMRWPPLSGPGRPQFGRHLESRQERCQTAADVEPCTVPLEQWQTCVSKCSRRCRRSTCCAAPSAGGHDDARLCGVWRPHGCNGRGGSYGC